jgi:transposase
LRTDRESERSGSVVVVRAKIVLLAAQGVANTAIAARLDVDVDVVSRWRRRFVAEGLAGLGDRRRCGRPRSFPARVVTEVKAAQAVVEGLA